MAAEKTQEEDESIFPMFRERRLIRRGLREDGRILPVINRQTPLLSRVRDRNTSDNVAEELGELVGQVVKSDNQREIQETVEEFRSSFSASLAEELGIDTDDIDETFIESVTSSVAKVEEEQVLRDQILQDLGVTEEEEQEQEEEGSDSEEEETDTETGLFDEDK